MADYRYTIIIPHRDIPQLLQRCIDSIPQRDDMEVVIVDDNSDPLVTDLSQLHLPAKNCRLIRTTEGRGAGYARNVGLDCSSSEFVLFCDADDFYAEGLGDFLDEHAHTDCDLVFFDNLSIDCHTLQPLDRDNRTVSTRMAQHAPEKQQGALRYQTPQPWTKLVRRELIDRHHIRFDEVPAANDAWFGLMVGHHARKVAFSGQALYMRTIRSDSLIHAADKEHLLSRLEVGYRVNGFLHAHRLGDYYVNTWPYLTQLRHVGWWLFVSEALRYFRRTPRAFVLRHLLRRLRRVCRME